MVSESLDSGWPGFGLDWIGVDWESFDSGWPGYVLDWIGVDWKSLDLGWNGCGLDWIGGARRLAFAYENLDYM